MEIVMDTTLNLGVIASVGTAFAVAIERNID